MIRVDAFIEDTEISLLSEAEYGNLPERAAEARMVLAALCPECIPQWLFFADGVYECAVLYAQVEEKSEHQAERWIVVGDLSLSVAGPLYQ